MQIPRYIPLLVTATLLAGCVEEKKHDALGNQQKRQSSFKGTPKTTTSTSKKDGSKPFWDTTTASPASASVPTQTNGSPNEIFRVLCFFPINMWKSFDPAGDPNPEGFTFVMYLLSHESNKGVYAPGVFRVRIFMVEQLEDGTSARGLVFDQTADMDELPRRDATRFGVGYQPEVTWGEVDLLGKDIEIVIQYETPDGRKVQSQTKRVKVPTRKAS
jgi:hypothetical protein